MISSGLLDRQVRSVDVLHKGRAAGGRIDAEGSGVREQIENALAGCELARQLTTLALIQEEASLLSGRGIDLEAQSVFDDRGRRRSFTDRFRIGREFLEAPRRQIVVEKNQT